MRARARSVSRVAAWLCGDQLDRRIDGKKNPCIYFHIAQVLLLYPADRLKKKRKNTKTIYPLIALMKLYTIIPQVILHTTYICYARDEAPVAFSNQQRIISSRRSPSAAWHAQTSRSARRFSAVPSYLFLLFFLRATAITTPARTYSHILSQ